MKLTKKEAEAFKFLNKKVNQKWKKFSKYYINDSKKFINKISRDYEKPCKYSKMGFPVHVLKTIKKIPKEKYDSAVCVLRGALPYALIFELYGWKIHYVICGRKNEKIAKTPFDLRFNKGVDNTLNKIKGKKVLLIENNSFTGNTSLRTLMELKKSFKIKKPDLFLDYFVVPHKDFAKETKRFKYNSRRKSEFGNIYVSRRTKVSNVEKEKLLGELLEKLK